MNFFKRLLASFLAAAVVVSGMPAQAFMPRSPMTTFPAATGLTLQNVEGSSGYPFINFFKQNHQYGFSSGTSPADLNAFGYPANTASLANNITLVGGLPPTSTYSGNYILGWTGTCAFSIAGASAPNSFNIVGTTGGVSVITSSFNLLVAGSTGSVTFSFNSSPTLLSEAFAGGEPYTNCAGMYLIRADQQSAFNGASIPGTTTSNVFQSEYLSWYITEGPKIFRFMDFVNTNGSNVADYRYRPTLGSSFTYQGEQYPPGAQGGSITGTDNFSITSFPDMPSGGACADGETVQATFANSSTATSFTGATNNGAGLIRLTGVSSTSGIANGAQITVETGGFPVGIYTAANVVANTSIDLAGSTFTNSISGDVSITPTLTVGSCGPYTLISANGEVANPFPSLRITAGQYGLFTFKADISQWVMTTAPYGDNGLAYGAPYELLFNLCNQLNKDCYIATPAFINDASLQTLSSAACSALNQGLAFYVEPENEIWNGNIQTFYTQYASQVLGYPATNGYEVLQASIYTHYASQVERIHSNTTAGWTGAGCSPSRLHTVLASQGQNLPLTQWGQQLRFNGNYTGARVSITGITNASPAVVTAPGNSFTTGQQVYLGGQPPPGPGLAAQHLPTCGMTEIDNAPVAGSPYTVHAVSGSNVTLYDATNTTPVNATGYGTWGATAPTITLTGTPTSGSYPTNVLWTASGGHHLQVGNTITLSGTVPAGFYAGVMYDISQDQYTSTTFTLTAHPAGAGGTEVAATGSASGTITLQQTLCGGGQLWAIPSSGNAPANYSVLAEANYYQGGQLTAPGGNPAVGNYYSVAILAGTGNLLNEAYNYVNGNSTAQTAALAWMDNDIRQGTNAVNQIASTNCPNASAVFTLPLPLNYYEAQGFSYSYGSPIFLSNVGGSLPTGFSAAPTSYIVTNQNQGAGTFQVANAATPSTPLGCTGAGSGTNYVGVIGGGTLLEFSTVGGGGTTFNGVYAEWATQAATWGTKVINYEGGYQGAPPTGSLLNSLVAGSFIAKIDNGSGGVGNTLTVTTMGEGYLAVGQTINASGVAGSPTITAYVGGTGQTGTYTISGSAQLIASENMQVIGDFYNPPYAYGGDVPFSTIATTSACTWSTSSAHHLVAGNTVILTDSGGSLPTPFLGFTNYYVVATNLTSTNVCFAATPGGSPIIPTANGSGTVTFSQDAGDVFALLLAYKKNPAFKQLTIDQLNQYIAGSGPGAIAGVFGDIGQANTGTDYGSPWALSPGDEYVTPYTSYNGICVFNGGSC